MLRPDWEHILYELVVKASTDLPLDVEQALSESCRSEAAGSNAAQALASMLENIRLARQTRRPLCQDTGSLLFWVEAPSHLAEQDFRKAANAAVARATAEGVLRQNCVDSLSGRNTGDNLGLGSPSIHWTVREGRESVVVQLLLKGGGCENVGIQYSLPDTELAAGRDLDGVRRCLLDAVWRAQGRGCAPGVLGVCIGGDRASGYVESKRQLLRRIGERSNVTALAELEERVLRESNSLGIGPMGFGGKTTLLDLFIGTLHRVPASYFVSISYMCWSYRRQSCCLQANGELLWGVAATDTVAGHGS